MMTTFVVSATTLVTPAAFMNASMAVGLSIGSIIIYAVNFYVLIIFVWAILSWFNKGTGVVNDIYQALDKIVSPYVGLFRKLIPSAGGMDFSPFIAIIVLQIVVRILAGVLPI
jgi:YggT family protein